MSYLSALFPPSTTAAAAQQAVAERRAVVLDVRERREWKAGHVPGSKNVPLPTLPARIAELSRDRRNGRIV